MTIRVKKLKESAVIPSKAHEHDAGFDLTATSEEINTALGYIEYGTGLAISIPEGKVGLLFPRSSVSKHNLSLANSVGVLDARYEDEVRLRFRIGDNEVPTTRYKVGERIGQLVVLDLSTDELMEVEDFNFEARGSGFGSSGE